MGIPIKRNQSTLKILTETNLLYKCNHVLALYKLFVHRILLYIVRQLFMIDFNP